MMAVSSCCKFLPFVGLSIKKCILKGNTGSPICSLVSCTATTVRKYAAIATAKDDYIFRQLLDYNTFTYTYLLADKASKDGVLIDPVLEMVNRDVDLARELGVNLIYGINTHMHADHITGTGEIKKKVKNFKSVICKHTSAKADRYVVDGEIIKFGKFELECRNTPGHTDGGCMTYVWHDKGVAFTGDALFVRGCGRTDFQGGSSRRLYESCHKKIFTLPDYFLLYPGHDYSGRTVTTVGEEKKYNPRLTKSLEEFTNIMKNLNLASPKFIDVAIPGNLNDGIVEKKS